MHDDVAIFIIEELGFAYTLSAEAQCNTHTGIYVMEESEGHMVMGW